MKRIMIITLVLLTALTTSASADMFDNLFPSKQLYQVIDIPGDAVVDTTGYAANLDSLNAEVQADTTAGSMFHARFLKVYGNDSVGIEKGMFSVHFFPAHDSPDSLFLWIRATSTATDTCYAVVTLKDASGNVEVTETISATVADTWERKAYALSSSLENNLYELILVAYMGQGYAMDISPAYLK